VICVVLLFCFTAGHAEVFMSGDRKSTTPEITQTSQDNPAPEQQPVSDENIIILDVGPTVEQLLARARAEKSGDDK
jgi:hypothetical protein